MPWQVPSTGFSLLLSAALLVFFATLAGTRVVASDLGTAPNIGVVVAVIVIVVVVRAARPVHVLFFLQRCFTHPLKF